MTGLKGGRGSQGQAVSGRGSSSSENPGISNKSKPSSALRELQDSLVYLEELDQLDQL